ncbi:MAG: tyrosine-protein phosphatase [Nocardioides sp.]|uniref:tyrosine-protein phosphatase n=1 Tax=Nocardioides sp. TaxID=35761 RepID=UPI0039E41DC4
MSASYTRDRRRFGPIVATLLVAFAGMVLVDSDRAEAFDASQVAPDNAAIQWEGRSLGLEHAPNARDVGGYPTADGRWVRTGVAYRSGRLGGLTSEEWQVLRDRGVNQIIDLRNTEEKSEAPDNQPSDIAYQESDITGIPPGLDSAQLTDLLSTAHCLAPGTPVSLLTIGNATLAEGDPEDIFTAEGYLLEACYAGSLMAFRDAITTLADASTTVIFHCSAGKDRTGVLDAILLTILGVDRETVLDDFEASNAYRGAGSVQREWLEGWFQAVSLDWLSWDDFVRNGLGLSDATVAALRTRFLTDTDPLAPAGDPAPTPTATPTATPTPPTTMAGTGTTTTASPSAPSVLVGQSRRVLRVELAGRPARNLRIRLDGRRIATGVARRGTVVRIRLAKRLRPGRHVLRLRTNGTLIRVVFRVL